jgi:hypothetical protein
MMLVRKLSKLIDGKNYSASSLLLFVDADFVELTKIHGEN